MRGLLNRKQWLTFGIGFILLSLFIGFFGHQDCTALQNTNLELIEAGMNTMDEWVISCLDGNVYKSLISTIIFTIGALFVIAGFLEKRK